MTHDIAMTVRAVLTAVDDLDFHVGSIPEDDLDRLEQTRYQLEQIILKARYPILKGKNIMGLDTSHNCWQGAYSYFNEWRRAVAKAAGIPNLEAYWASGSHNVEQIHGLWIEAPENPIELLLNHSDCEGWILAHHGEDLANALAKLLPSIQIEWRNATERFIE